jgi:glycogen synthase
MTDPHWMQALTSWKRDSWAMSALFSDWELNRLEAARLAVRRDRRTVVFCVYENRFAKAGGLFAVASQLPPQVCQGGSRALVLSPLHTRLATAPDMSGDAEGNGPLRPCGQTTVPFGGSDVPVTLWEHELGGIRWVLFQAAGFFEAQGGPRGNIPYDFTAPDGSSAQPRLDVDSLFAAAAVPRILQHLGIVDDVLIHAHDWQFAAVALTIKLAILENQLHSAAVVLTSHNPYDCGLPAERLGLITNRVADRLWPTLKHARAGDPPPVRRDTFYECMLPLLDAPVSTVSRGFADDLLQDPVQTVHFANHLQQVFQRQGVIGINNGLFLPATQSAFSAQATRLAKQGRPSEIVREKRQQRALILQHLPEYLPENAIGRLDGGNGRSLDELPDDVPIFMMFGRMDPAQKGFDVLARAVERVERGRAKFIFALEATGGVRPFIEDLRRLAEDRPGDVLFIPDRMTAGYLETMAGVSYCVMPSLYEPFGAATEPYLKGTPGIAHATGGLVQQVRDVRSDPDGGTGLLYRPTCPAHVADQLGAYWDHLLDCATPEARGENPLYHALAEALAETVREAIRISVEDTECYGRMLANLYDQALQFSWEAAARQYTAWYDAAGR